MFRRQLSMNTKYDFYKSIGSPKYFAAPMVDQSELAFRLLTRQNGVDACFTQMILAKSYLCAKDYRRTSSDWSDYSHSSGSIELSKKAEALDKNLIIQIAGDNPDNLVKTGKLIQHRAAAIDLNLGCPQNTARKGNYGSHLLQDTELTLKLLKTLVTELEVPITAKIRIYDDDDRTIEFCQNLEKLGLSMITVHCRTVQANKLFVGAADWIIIKRIKEAVSIPVIANGGISNLEDANRCMRETGVDGVMSSEALLENPKLFSSEGNLKFQINYIQSQFDTVDEYLALVEGYYKHEPKLDAVRSHLFKLLYRFVDASKNSDLRTMLAEGTRDQMKYVVEELKHRLSVVQSYDPEVAIQTAVELGLLGPTIWYMRHRDSRAAARILSAPRLTSISKRQMTSCYSDENDNEGRYINASEDNKFYPHNVSSKNINANTNDTTSTVVIEKSAVKLGIEARLAELRKRYANKRLKLSANEGSDSNIQ